jgi:hypothetical protein
MERKILLDYDANPLVNGEYVHIETGQIYYFLESMRGGFLAFNINNFPNHLVIGLQCDAVQFKIFNKNDKKIKDLELAASSKSKRLNIR